MILRALTRNNSLLKSHIAWTLFFSLPSDFNHKFACCFLNLQPLGCGWPIPGHRNTEMIWSNFWSTSHVPTLFGTECWNDPFVLSVALFCHHSIRDFIYCFAKKLNNRANSLASRESLCDPLITVVTSTIISNYEANAPVDSSVRSYRLVINQEEFFRVWANARAD